MLKFSLALSREFSIMSLASGGFAPRPHRGSAPGPRWGFPSPRPPVPHPLCENPGSTTGGIGEFGEQNINMVYCLNEACAYCFLPQVSANVLATVASQSWSRFGLITSHLGLISHTACNVSVSSSLKPKRLRSCLSVNLKSLVSITVYSSNSRKNAIFYNTRKHAWTLQ